MPYVRGFTVNLGYYSQNGVNDLKPFSHFSRCVEASGCPTPADSAERKNDLSNLLNNAPASYEGALVRFRRGIYHYICSRNNNFTNRSQKGTLIVQ